jgi:hypothetical protein
MLEYSWLWDESQYGEFYALDTYPRVPGFPLKEFFHASNYKTTGRQADTTVVTFDMSRAKK